MLTDAISNFEKCRINNERTLIVEQCFNETIQDKNAKATKFRI